MAARLCNHPSGVNLCSSCVLHKEMRSINDQGVQLHQALSFIREIALLCEFTLSLEKGKRLRLFSFLMIRNHLLVLTKHTSWKWSLLLCCNKSSAFSWLWEVESLRLVFKQEAPKDVNSNLVDSASSHTLVSKIKPCMSKYKRFYTVKLRTAH